MSELNEKSITLITDDNQSLVIGFDHKLQISAKSVYFSKLLFGWSSDSMATQIHMKDTTGHSLKFLINYLLTNCLDFRSIGSSEVIEIIKLSNRLNCESVYRKSITTLSKLIHSENCFEIYLFNKLYDLRVGELCLEDHCLQYMSKFADQVFKTSQTFRELSFETFGEIIERIPHSRYESVIEESIKAWVQSDCNQREELEEKLLSICYKRRQRLTLTESRYKVWIERPVYLIDCSLKICDLLVEVKNICFDCNRIELYFDLSEKFCLDYMKIRSICLRHDSHTCKCLLSIRTKHSFTVQLNDCLKTRIQSNELKILFSDPIQQIKDILGQLFRYIDCKYTTS